MDLLLAFLVAATDFVRPLTEALKPWTAVFSFLGALLGVAATTYGVLQRRLTKKTKAAAEDAHAAANAAEAKSDTTNDLVVRLIDLLEKRQRNHDDLFAAYVKRDALTPERIAEIARAALEEDLRPIREVLLEQEIDQHRHRRSEMPTVALELEGAAA